MAKYAALLRGVNVGGNKLAMAGPGPDRRGLGGRDVRTYLQSGNVVYAGAKKVATGLERLCSTSRGPVARPGPVRPPSWRRWSRASRTPPTARRCR